MSKRIRKYKHSNNPNSYLEISQENIQKSFSLGVEQASYLSGFASSFAPLNFTSENLQNIIIAKMNLEYQQEITRMKLETEERIAREYATSSIINSEEDEN